MISNLFIGRDAFISFSGFITGTTLIIPALFWLFFEEKEYNNQTKTKEKKPTQQDSFTLTTWSVLWLSLVVIVLLIAPGTSFIIKKSIDNQPYVDTMIAIPTALIVAYAFVHLLQRLHVSNKKRKGITFCLFILMLINISIPISYGHPLGIELISDPMKIRSETKELCAKIGSTYVLLPEEIYGQIGEYDSDVNADSLYEISHDRYYAYNVYKKAVEKDASLLVIRKTDDYAKMEEEYGFKQIDHTDHYLIYQRLQAF